MVNLKVSRKDYEVAQPAMATAPQYPYGLRICLDEETLQKLGIKDLPEVGDKLSIKALVEVASTSEYESLEGGKRRSLDLQITDMGLGSQKKEVDADKIYNKK